MEVAREPEEVLAGLHSLPSPPETLRDLLGGGGEYDNPAVSKNCSKNPQTPSPTINVHSKPVSGNLNGTEGTSNIARNDITVVNSEKYVTETKGWHRWPMIRIDVYAHVDPRTPTIIAKIATIC
jgi:hypothetical protein